MGGVTAVRFRDRFHVGRRVIDWSWRSRGRCVQTTSVGRIQQVDGDTAEMFFPVGEHTEVADARAKAYCHTCPVREICLADALLRAHTDEDGVRGGLTVAERRALSTEQREALIALCATAARDDEEEHR